ncbi:MAG: hypothetical protein IKL13_05520, partial [Clostridia bacterium]|nr:hypothetical protein [Clostridia bacterium]
MKMRKIVAVLMAVLMLCCIVPFAAMAEGSSASIDFGDKANRVSYSTEQQVWAQNGITVTNDKAASTSNVGDYGGDGYPVRFYQNSSVTIAYPGMTKIVVNCDDYKASYPTALESSISGADVSVDGFVVTITLPAAADTFVIEALSAQVRVDSITVYTGEAGGDTPVEPPVTPDDPVEDPEPDTELTIADAIALGTSKDHNTYTEGKYFVTGVITEVYNTTYGNMKITDDAGNILTIYGSYSADGELRYDAMDVKPVAGDTVTVYGIVGQYNGNAQIKNGWIVDHVPGEDPVEPDEPSTDLVLIDEPKAGVAYKFGMIQANVSATDVYYLKGGMNGYYMDTATDVAVAIDVYLEETDGGYYMYTMVDGAKTYINMVVSGT